MNEQNAGTYVYCVARAGAFDAGAPPFRAPAIGGRGDPIYAVRFMDLAAVVSDCAQTRFDIRREHTIAHQVVVEEAMTWSDVLPVRFSTIARSPDEVQEKLLKRRFGALHHLLRYVEGQVELGLKVFWHRDRLFADIVADSAPIRSLRDAVAGRPAEEMHYERIKLGQLTEEAMSRKREQEAEQILDALHPLAVDLKVNKVLTDLMVLNAAFLVDRAREREFDAAVGALGDARAGRLILKYVGPLPPYNFVSLTIRWDEE